MTNIIFLFLFNLKKKYYALCSSYCNKSVFFLFIHTYLIVFFSNKLKLYLQNICDSSIQNLEKTLHASGCMPTAELRAHMRNIMQMKCSVFREQKLLDEGNKKRHVYLKLIPNLIIMVVGSRVFFNLLQKERKKEHVINSDHIFIRFMIGLNFSIFHVFILPSHGLFLKIY